MQLVSRGAPTARKTATDGRSWAGDSAGWSGAAGSKGKGAGEGGSETAEASRGVVLNRLPSEIERGGSELANNKRKWGGFPVYSSLSAARLDYRNSTVSFYSTVNATV